MNAEKCSNDETHERTPEHKTTKRHIIYYLQYLFMIS